VDSGGDLHGFFLLAEKNQITTPAIKKITGLYYP